MLSIIKRRLYLSRKKMDLGIGSRIRNDEMGVGVIIQTKEDEVLISFVNSGVQWLEKSYIKDEFTILEDVKSPNDFVSLGQIEDTIRDLFSDIIDQSEEIDLGNKWVGGKLVFQPANEELKPYELPVETFFHKIVMVRDRLRVMEQRINSSNLSDEEKVNLQQYITKIYGSLTSFNILFSSKEVGFTGSSK